ncbi:MAG: HPF/RaiA family ribosome-associated protein [Steroidobacteraceae bacterium]
MQVLVNSDHHITSSQSVAQRVTSILLDSVDRFADRLTRVEVHLNDVNGPKHGERDKRVTMEARVAGRAPVAVTNDAPSLLEAIEGASKKLERALEHTFGRLDATARKGPADEDTVTLETLTELDLKEQEKRGKH